MPNRDSLALWVALAVAIVTYLASAGKPPQEWSYAEWIQAASFILAYLSGKLATSPLPGKNAAPLGSVEPRA